jgi:hypothetical protein
MTDFERDLQRTLKRREPPRDLRPAVMARIETSTKRTWSFGGFYWRQALAAAAVLVVLAAGIDRYREYRRGQEAEQQLLLALQITGRKLALVQAKVDKLNRRGTGPARPLLCRETGASDPRQAALCREFQERSIDHDQ